MINFISVILPTYNPNLDRLNLTIKHLEQQTLAIDLWELIIIDNNSNQRVTPILSKDINSKIIFVEKQGLTHARLAGFKVAKGELIVMVDDDNLLDRDYLKNALTVFDKKKDLGAAGGKVIPLFDTSPETWLKNFYSSLAIRDLGNEELIATWENKYPDASPIGAGMVIRKEALQSYINKAHVILDRTGSFLSSGGDNDIVLEILKSGWKVGYFPKLTLQHIIPKSRMAFKYICKLINHSNKSWVILLESHQINPWKKISSRTLKLRKIKAWFSNKAWMNKTNYIKWRAACGLFDGLAE
ncbi:glycosyltransferase [Pedobacter aquatilis]|uniref:glycosyltransferase n=1 Tax=Pedobacter aquatilis TaxID=351343 RepID=UPI002930434E|nr:glycosyltransferase [Pedobacter aquatilis]